MSSNPASDRGRCAQRELVISHALGARDAGDRTVLQAHISVCSECRDDLLTLDRLVGDFAFWPIDVLRPSPALWQRMSERIAVETGDAPPASAAHAWAEPAWEDVAPGISCKLLATDTDNDRITMLVRLAPGIAYPAHRHAGVEELHLLDGDLWIEERRLSPGDYNRAEPDTEDQRVWSENGCTCVLITSIHDVLL